LNGQVADTTNRNKTRYGLEISRFITSSGFASGTELYVTIIPDNKRNISLGLYFCPEQMKLCGITTHYEIALYKACTERTIRPYAFHNIILRITRTRILIQDSIESELGTYISLEHHLGIGTRIKISKRFYLNSSVGFGVYLGSIMKPSEPDEKTGEITGTNGFGVIGKVGIVFIL
jgi:hypothetical protein